jgi:phosphatidylglycerophosphate synthase
VTIHDTTTDAAGRPPATTPPATTPPATFGEALRALRAAQKSSVGAPAYSRFVNRPLGRIIAAAAFRAGLGPNTVTMISAAITLSGIALIALVPPTTAVAITVSALLVLGYAFDAADGQLARLSGRGSLAGEWLDHVVDALKAGAIHLAVAVSWFRFADVPAGWLLVPLGFSVVASVFFFGMILTDQLRRLHRGSADMIKKAGRTPLWYAIAVVPVDYGFLCVLFLLLATGAVFQWAYTAVFVINALVLAASLVRWFRAVRRLT